MSNKVKVVDLDFYCDVDDGNAWELLDLRVTPSLRRSYQWIVANDLLNPLHVILNDLIKTSLGAAIGQDLGETVLSVDTFTGSVWTPGTHGYHEADLPVAVTLQSAGPDQPWEYAYTGGSSSTARVRVRVQWVNRSIKS